MMKIIKRVKKIIRDRLPATQKDLDEVESAYYEVNKKLLEVLESVSETCVMNRNDINNLAREITNNNQSGKSKNSTGKKGNGVMFG